MKITEDYFSKLLKKLADIGIALSAEKNHTLLLENILQQALEITNADGGTLYSCVDDKELKFEIMINKSMGLHYGGTSPNKIHFENLPLYDKSGKANLKMVATWVTLKQKSINLTNAYANTDFDFSGTKSFDKKTGYHSQAFLTVPMTNHLHEVIGVLQLINPIDKNTHKIISFTELDELITESLASQAAISITNAQLIEAQKQLFDSLIQLIANAIDEKSPYTGAHCKRVPILTKMIAKAACEATKGPLKEFSMSDDALYELEVAAWLHDCGKIITPEAVVDKATKLERIIDGIQLIEARIEIVKRDATIHALQNFIKKTTGSTYNLQQDNNLQQQLEQLNKEYALLKKCNVGGEQMRPEDSTAITQIAKHTWQSNSGKDEPLLTESEISNLNIRRGTLSDQERSIINNHVSMTLKMLNSLPYPKKLKNVPELAGSHHEKLDGTGYPRGLKEQQLSLPARMIAIADVFEALTSSDRPYKKAMPLSRALSILGQMKVDNHIDPDLFDLFIDAKIYQQYAEKYLAKEAFDTIDLKKIPGYKPLN